MQLRNDHISLDKLNLSTASPDFIYEVVCNHYGVKVLSPDFLTATFASRVDCIGVDWYAYFQEQRELRQIIRMTSFEEEDPDIMTTQAHIPPSEPSEPITQASTQGENMEDSNIHNLSSSPRLKPQPTQAPLTPQKSVRFAQPSSNPALHPQSPSPSPSQSVPPRSSVSPTSKHRPSSTHPPLPSDTRSRRTPSLEEYEQLEIPVVESSSDPSTDICMSGAVHPADTHPAFVPSNSTKGRRLKSSLCQDDNIVCSTDPRAQLFHMPHRLISIEELAETRAENIFVRPDEALRWLPYNFYTTNAGFFTAVEVSKRQLERYIHEQKRRLREELGLSEHEKLPNELKKETRPSGRQQDLYRALALLQCGGEFDYNDGRWVKYPENLVPYAGRMRDVDFGPPDGPVAKYWEHLWRRGEEFWGNVCASPTFEADDEQDVEMHDSIETDEVRQEEIKHEEV